MPVFRVLDDALEVRHRHEVLRAEAWGTDCARVRVARYRIPAESVGALDTAPEHGGTVTVSAAKTTAQLVNGELTVTVTFHGDSAYPESRLTFIEGGRTLTVEAPIERIPVFTTHGTDLPLKETE
jgi:alpha-D-xyloside xylohydrolase